MVAMPTSVSLLGRPLNRWRPSHLRRRGEYQQGRRTYGDAANDRTMTLAGRWLRVSAVHHIGTCSSVCDCDTPWRSKDARSSLSETRGFSVNAFGAAFLA